MANLLIERSQNSNWIVVYKALVTVHHLMCYGNERFTQYLASNNCTFQLTNFFDKSGVHGVLGAKTGYDMSPFIRKYARYLNEKALSYRSVAFDFCKVKRGKEDGILRTMNAEKLLKTLPCLQSQLDILLEFDCSANDLSNGIINMCFMLLFRDLIRLFACYNDGIINLLEKYFDMNKKQCKEGLDIYKKFLVRMDRVAEFLKVAENVGIDKGDLPDLTKAPGSLLEALEQHLGSIDGKKTASTTSTPSQSSSTVSQKNTNTTTKATANFNTSITNGHATSHTNGIDEHLKEQMLAEEEAVLNKFKSKVHSSPTNNNPFLITTTNNASSVNSAALSHEVNLLDNEPIIMSGGTTTVKNKTSDDLLQLNNPFAETFPPTQSTVSNSGIYQNNTWATNGTPAYSSQPVITNGAFVSDTNFAAVFGSIEPKSTVLQPSLQDGPADKVTPNLTSNKTDTHQRQQSSGALLTGDLDSSLASLAENLTIRSPTVMSVQWNSPKNGSKPNWTPQPLAATTGAGYKPMNQTVTNPPPPIMQQSVYQPQIQPTMGLRPLATNTTMYTQRTGMMVVTPTSPVMNPMGQQQSLLFN